MNYRHQQKQIVYANIAFYVCMTLAAIALFKGYQSIKQPGAAAKATMAGLVGFDPQSGNQTGSPSIDPAMLSKIAQLIQQPSSSQPVSTDSKTSDGKSNNTPVVPVLAQGQIDSAQNPIAAPQSGAPSGGQDTSALMAYLVKTLPQNIGMLKAVLRAETQLTQGDSTEAGPVDQTLAHPLAQPSQPTQSDQAIDRAVAVIAPQGLSQGQTSGFGGSDPNGFLGGLQGAGQGQAYGGQSLADMGLTNTPLVFGIICFALGMVAPHLFKRRDPAVIYRPNTGQQPPSIYFPGWQNNRRRQVQMVQPESFCTYKPYFVGQELEVTPGQPFRNPMTSYARIKQASQNFRQSSNKMVRRFLEL